MSKTKWQSCQSKPTSQCNCSRQRSIYSKSNSCLKCVEYKYCQNYPCDSWDYAPKREDLAEQCKEIPKRSRVEADSMGPAVGAAFSTRPVVRPCACMEEEMHEMTFAQDFATYLKAFALIYVLPERQWSGENIDKLLREGEDLFQESSEADAEGLPRSQVYTNIEQRVSRKFKLEGHSFTIELSPAFRGTDPEHSMHQMKQLKSMLQQFFRKSYHGLFLSKGGYLLIWRRRKFYFVLDVKGRRAADLVSVRFNGLATVVCVQNLSNVTHLITNLSSHSSTDQFTIRELCVVRLVTPDGRIFLRDSNQRDVQYSVINKNYAYLKSTLHLSMNPKETLRNHSSLMVGVAAILASKIDHPAGWNTNMFDRLMCYGVELCRSCWGASVQERLPIDLDTFPTQLRLGQFLMELRLLPNYASGRWSCGIRYQGNDFEYEIRRALDKHSNALFQINNQMYALWRKDDFYYLLDPYRHTVISPALQTSEDEVTKWATVRMFRDLPTLLSVFHQLLKESNRQAPFNIHVVHIKNLVKCPAGYSLRPLPKDVDLEVLSLNEAIGFPVELNNCESILGEISDYEPDLVSETEDGFDIEKFKLLDEKDFDKLDEDEGEEEQEEEKQQQKKAVKANKQLAAKKVTIDTNRPAAGGIRIVATPIDPKSQRVAGGALSKAAQRAMEKHQIPLGVTINDKRQATMAADKKDDIKPAKDFWKDKSAKKEPCQLQRPKTFECKCQAAKRKSNAACQTAADCANVSESSENSSKDISYPVYTKFPYNLAIAGSESGTVESLHRLLNSAFNVANRVLIMTPWGNFVVFKMPTNLHDRHAFYLFDGCTCNVDRFRHLDLSYGTAGLLPFRCQSDVVCYMIDSRELRAMKMLNLPVEKEQQFESLLSCAA